MSAHTQGPWEIPDILDRSIEAIINEQRVEIALVRAISYTKSNGSYQEKPLPYESNASLIAAAPELLEICEQVFEDLEKFKNDDWVSPKDVLLFKKVSAAIAKAKGGYK